MSPLLDYPRTEKSARTRTDTTTTSGAFRGTDGSNPVPSSGESANFRFRSRCRDVLVFAMLGMSDLKILVKKAHRIG